MFEHFWARFARREKGLATKPTLRVEAMRNLYLQEGRSQTERPASKPVWQRMIEQLKRRSRDGKG